MASAGIAIATVYPLSFYGLIPKEELDLAFWLITLPVWSVVLLSYIVITGHEVKIGKNEYSLSINLLLLILGVSLALVGFVIAGSNGVIIGVLIQGTLWTPIMYLRNKLKHKRR